MNTLLYTLSRQQSSARILHNINKTLMLIFLFSYTNLVFSQTSQPNDSNNSQITPKFQINIRAGPLSQTLQQLSQQSHMRIIVSSALVEQQQSIALNGQYTALEALQRLLDGHHLALNIDGNTAVIRDKAENSALLLGAINIEGSNTTIYSPIAALNPEHLSHITGANGSRDLTATEGNKSYAQGNISITGRAPISAQKVSQSVGIVSAQQIEDQKAITLTDALKSATGVFVQSSGGIDSYYSRGYQMNSFSVDGVAVDKNSSITNDLSLYDHVEVLRGTDAFLSSFASNASATSGSINLVRKKPLDHLQTQIDLATGSWEHYRQSIDITGPLALDGALRGRMIVTHVDKKEFWRGEQSTKNIADLRFEYDLTPDTTINFGTNYSENKGPKWQGSIPRDAAGKDLALPYRFSSITPGVQDKLLIYSLDIALEHNFNDHWSARLNAHHYNRQTDSLSPYISTTHINTAGHNKMEFKPNSASIRDEKTVYNAVLFGKFKALQRQHSIELSLQHTDSELDEKRYYGKVLSVDYHALTDIDFANLIMPTINYNIVNWKNTHETIDLAYIKFDFELLKNLHFLTGPRWLTSNYTNENQQRSRDSKFYIPYYGLRYDFSPQWSAYASYSNNFIFQQNLTSKDLTKLNPQIGYTQEIGLKYQSPSQQLTGSFALFQSRFKNAAKFIWDGTTISNPISGCCWSTNGSEDSSRGIELELSGQFTPHWQSTIGYTYNNNRIHYKELPKSVPLDLGYFPKHNLKWSNSIQLWGNDWLQRISLGANAIYVSKQDRKQHLEDKNLQKLSISLKQSEYVLADLFMRYQINPQWQLQLNVNNVLNKKYYSGLTNIYSTRYGAPRNFLLSLQAKY